MFSPPKSYYSIGWSVHLHRQNQLFGYTLCNAFPAYRSSETGKETLRSMESYQLPTLIYDFPSEFLQEKTGYLVSGSHMGMGVNRRKKNWRQLESSFWILIAQYNSMVQGTVPCTTVQNFKQVKHRQLSYLKDNN